jgi:phosphoribosylamine---glycine ligase
MTHAVVVGAGGREHALARALRRDGAEVTVTPGNDGMRADGLRCVADGAVARSADLVIVGPEEPLVAGVADELRATGVAVVGPGADGARLEGSKAFLKRFLADAGVPTAEHATFSEVAAAQEWLRARPGPYVIKTDGLAAGKGVLVTSDLAEALADVAAKVSGDAFGDAGRTVVLEEFLDGEECSVLALCDGTRVVPLLPAQDYKRVGDLHTGPNTGGMGARAPLAAMGPGELAEVQARILAPTVRALRARGIDYRGVLYAGIMMTSQGPRLLEYNVRFGDPETQVVVPLWGPGFLDTMVACATGALDVAPTFSSGAAVTVVLAAPGYPQRPVLGGRIEGLGADGQPLAARPGVCVYHAGTRQTEDGGFVTAGGRVLAVTAVAADEATARDEAYAVAETISFEGRVMRTDIAARSEA